MRLDSPRRTRRRTGTGIALAILLVSLSAMCSVPAVAAASGHHRRHRKHVHHRHSAKPVTLTGLGATQQTWDALHHPDPAYPNNFDPMPEGTYPGAFENDQFTVVTFDELSRVNLFGQKFTPGTTQAAANAAVRALLPPDAKKVAGPVNPTSECAAEEFASQTLGAQDGGRSGILVTYKSYYDLNTAPYTSQDVREATVGSTHGTVPADQFGKGGFGALICG